MAIFDRLLDLSGPVQDELGRLAAADAAHRIFSKDHTLWSTDPTEISDRLGWLDVVAHTREYTDELATFAQGAYTDGLRDALVLGMGGSSLFPEVVARTFDTGSERLRLGIIDTTDPQTIHAVGRHDGRELESTLFVSASKSGSTIETRSATDTFWARLGRGSQFCAITDPGSELEAIAERDGYRRSFLNSPDIGGRFAALSFFGMVPAALAGAPVAEMLTRAQETLDEAANEGESSLGFGLGVAMAVAAQRGRDKLTVLCDPSIAAFGDWLEQLVAESTGKHGEGIVPVVDEDVDPALWGDDRFFVVIGDHPDADRIVDQPLMHLPLADRADLGRQVVLWELATAVAGVVLGLNPFDQPDVASAKAATNSVLSAGLPDIASQPLESILDQVKPGDYVAICAYVDPWSPEAHELRAVRSRIGHQLGVATTLGIGPRYLHSTGQLHKGKPQRVVVVQTIKPDTTDVAIPGQSFGFSTLKAAQAAGDLASLTAKGVRAARVPLDQLV